MKRFSTLFLAVLLMLSVLPAGFAAESGREYLFELSVDGRDTKQVRTGDVITVVFALERTDADVEYPMYAMQNEIRYDSGFFEPVEGSILLADGISSSDIGLRDGFRECYMNYVSMSGGEIWQPRQVVGSFQLRVTGESGVTKITSQDYLVSSQNGQDSCTAQCQDVTVILSEDCLVRFQSNGGTEIADQRVDYGKRLKRPKDPTREGYHLEGWYTDMDLQTRWDFETDTVPGNMTLYAKWAKGDPVRESGGWLLPGGIAVLGLLAWWLRRKKIR